MEKIITVSQEPPYYIDKCNDGSFGLIKQVEEIKASNGKRLDSLFFTFKDNISLIEDLDIEEISTRDIKIFFRCSKDNFVRAYIEELKKFAEFAKADYFSCERIDGFIIKVLKEYEQIVEYAVKPRLFQKIHLDDKP